MKWLSRMVSEADGLPEYPCSVCGKMISNHVMYTPNYIDGDPEVVAGLSMSCGDEADLMTEDQEAWIKRIWGVADPCTDFAVCETCMAGYCGAVEGDTADAWLEWQIEMYRKQQSEDNSSATSAFDRSACGEPGCSEPVPPNSLLYSGKPYCPAHYSEKVLASLWETFKSWDRNDEPPARFKYWLGRISEEEDWDAVGDSYLTAARIRDRGFNFKKTDNGCEFEITRHPGAWSFGPMSRVVQKWQANMREKQLTLVKTRKFKQGDFE